MSHKSFNGMFKIVPWVIGYIYVTDIRNLVTRLGLKKKIRDCPNEEKKVYLVFKSAIGITKITALFPALQLIIIGLCLHSTHMELCMSVMYEKVWSSASAIPTTLRLYCTFDCEIVFICSIYVKDYTDISKKILVNLKFLKIEGKVMENLRQIAFEIRYLYTNLSNKLFTYYAITNASKTIWINKIVFFHC